MYPIPTTFLIFAESIAPSPTIARVCVVTSSFPAERIHTTFVSLVFAVNLLANKDVSNTTFLFILPSTNTFSATPPNSYAITLAGCVFPIPAFTIARFLTVQFAYEPISPAFVAQKLML